MSLSDGVIKINRFQIHFKYKDKEMKQLLQSISILVDTREQKNQHILEYFDSNYISYELMKLDAGDYSVKLPAINEIGINRDIYFPLAIERKNSVNELVNSIKDRTRFENELIRSQKLRLELLVEDPNGYEKILKGNYKSQYNPKAFLASLKSFETRYGFTTVFIPKHAAGHYMYHHFYYYVRNYLKGVLS